MARSNRLPWALALIGFSLFLYFWGLGRVPFYTKGEPREALQVWEEVHNGDWILPMRNGVDLPSKPPLFHWLAGLAALAFGEVTEFSVRFPSAALATLSVLLVFWLGAEKWGTAAGVFAAFMLATNFEWMRAATTARVDMTLTALLIAAFVALDRVVSAPAPTPRALIAFYLSMALATLGKGPVGVVLPALVAMIYLALRRDLARWRQLQVVAGAVAVLVIAGSWYALAIARGGVASVQKQPWVENVGRFFAASASGAGHEPPFYYMIGGFFLGFAPWSFFVIPLAIHLYVNRRRLEMLGYLYPLVWFGAVFTFYSVSQSKRTVYLLPVYPAAALLLGAWWQSVASDPRSVSPILVRALRAVAIGLVVALVFSIILLLAVGFSAEPLAWLRPLLHEKDRANLPLLETLIRQRFTGFVLFVAALLPMIGVWLFSVRQKNWSLLFAALVAFVVSGEAVIDVAFEPALAERRSFKPFMETVRAVVEPEDSLSFYRAFDYGAVFYARRHVTSLHEGFGGPPPSDRRAYVLLWKSTWDRLPPERKDRLQHLLTSAGTGPKGRDALVFALLKPSSDPLL
ncbi:MAG: glycosyltransferase family 39 protein [Candidatus Binatia bacterium]|jgi:4-amino-4-deoxy-L-arabinose transferase-like glycosyltransferase